MKFSEMPYTRVDREETIEALKALSARAENAESGEELFAVHQDYYKLWGAVQTNYTLAYIRHGIDTTDAFYEKENDYYDTLLPELQEYQNAYQRILFFSPFRPYMEQKIGPVAFKNIEIALKAFDPKLIPLMQEENALCSRYTKLKATAKIPFRGEEYNLTGIAVFLTDRDRETRREAWKACSGYFLSVTAEIDEIYDAMVKNRTAQARALGYENYVELGYYRMNRNSYGREQVENFRRQVKESFVPMVTKINAKRAARLGIAEARYYDLNVYFNEGNPKPSGTPEEILKAGRAMYEELSPETREFFGFMMDNELFDVYGRKTKEQGGYMTFIPDYKSPFIFANFNGTSGDVDVITHECGHAFQGYLTRNDEIRENADITMETAEIHSMAMEYFTYGFMERFFGDRAADYRTMHAEDSCIFVPYGCMVDEFQHRVYENPDLTPAERKELWKRLEQEYRPDLDYCGDPFFGEGGYWQRQSHIFTSPFYYIDYVLASVAAMQYKVWMDEDMEGAWASYLKLCRLSASEFYGEELSEAGLRSPFADGTIAALTAEMEKKVL